MQHDFVNRALYLNSLCNFGKQNRIQSLVNSTADSIGSSSLTNNRSKLQDEASLEKGARFSSSLGIYFFYQCG